MTNCRTENTPQCGHSSATDDDALDKDLVQKYPSHVGSFMHLSNSTRPDISQAVNTLARYSTSPTKLAWAAGFWELQYPARHPTKGLLYNSNKSSLQGYWDANWAGDLETRRSTSRFVFVLHGGPVAWQSKLQSTVTCSTCEVDYQAAGMAAREALWLDKLLPEIGEPNWAVPILFDSQSTLALIKNPMVTARSKDIEVIHHFTWEKAFEGLLVFEYEHSDSNWADFLSKEVPCIKFEACIMHIGMGH